MIELDLVTGFLGAGKTTWLVGYRAQMYDLVIVNDFSEHPVDGAILAQAFATVNIGGGCVCCDASDQLLDALHSLVNNVHAGARTKRVALETSGVSEPAAIVELIRADPVLQENLAVRSTIVVAAIPSAIEMIRTSTVAVHQLIASDMVVLSHADVADENAVASAAGAIAAVNPSAMIVSREGRQVRVDPSATPDESGWAGGDQQRTHRFASWSTELAGTASWAQYALWLELMVGRHGDRLMRTKALFPHPEGAMIVHSVGRSILPVTEIVTVGDFRFMCIVDGIDVTRIERSFRAFVPTASV